MEDRREDSDRNKEARIEGETRRDRQIEGERQELTKR